MLEKTLERPLDCKEIQPVHPNVDQSWVFIGRTDAEAETPIFLPPDAKRWLIWKDPDAGKDWGQEEKGKYRGWDGWMASLIQWTWVWVDSGSWWWGQGGLACCGLWDHKELDMTEWLNWTESDIVPCFCRTLPLGKLNSQIHYTVSSNFMWIYNYLRISLVKIMSVQMVHVFCPTK